MIDINREIGSLISYGIEKNLIDKRDNPYVINNLLELLGLDEYREEDKKDNRPICEILDAFKTWALENNILEDDSIDSLDLYDTRIMARLAKAPSQIEREFWELYREDPTLATDYFYDYAKNINYIREDRIEKDIKWKYESDYGPIDITINMSKPEKDPRAIARARHSKSSSYPKCLLCKENEGYAGRDNHPARGNHRLIQLELAKEEWYVQYSPYVYYNEHCIVLKAQHEAMKISEKTFRRLLEFVRIFPHYFVGSNAGLPIVGGSILSHDHFQGGRYNFAMAEAREENQLSLKNKIEVSSLVWPMSVIRLKGTNIDNLVDTAYRIQERWENYNDESVDILSETNGEPHNAITPICRFRNGFYELDLVLRNNRTTENRPDGLFHPRPEYHNIKKENIGLIEVMGLAVLPSRLKKEMEKVKSYLLDQNLEALREDKELSKHYEFAKDIDNNFKINKENINGIIEEEIGRVFLNVLKDAGLFKEDEEGRLAFKKCREALVKDLNH